MNGMYTCPKRVERDGRLVAFEGEVMTMAEAVSRGLVAEEKPKAKRKPKAPKAEETPAEVEEAKAEETPEEE